MRFGTANGGVADVDLEEVTKERGVTLEETDGLAAEVGMAVHEEKGFGHEGGKTLDATVSVLVCGEVVFVECFGESRGLTECEGEAFSGDGVDRTRGVADQSDVASRDTVEGAAEGDGSVSMVGQFCCGETLAKSREMCEGVIGRRNFLIGDEGDADLG